MKKIFASLFTFSVLLVFNSCQKEYSLEGKGTVGDARGSLKDSLGNCLPITVHGTFYNGVTPGPDTAYVEVSVDVDTIGAYNIRTDLQNGFMFADSGYFNTPGINTIKLKPVGTPILLKSTDFVVTFDTTSCPFTIYVQDSTGTGLGGGNGGGNDTTNLSDTAWKFTANDNFNYNGPIDVASIKDTLGNHYLYMIGYTAATNDTAFFVNILLPGDTIVPGTYTTDIGSIFYFYDLNNLSNPFIYQADPTTTGFKITITVDSYDPVTKIVRGTVTGTAKDGSGNAVNITNGTFTVHVT